MSTVLDLEYVLVYDVGSFLCIEDKVLTQYPVVSKTNTRTVYEMWFDVVELPDGEQYIARACYPKSVPTRLILKAAYTWNDKWVRKAEEARMLAQAQAQQSGRTEEGSEEYLKRLREYLKQLR